MDSNLSENQQLNIIEEKIKTIDDFRKNVLMEGTKNNKSLKDLNDLFFDKHSYLVMLKMIAFNTENWQNEKKQYGTNSERIKNWVKSLNDENKTVTNLEIKIFGKSFVVY